MGGRLSEVIDLDHRLALFSDHWHPRIVTALSDHNVKLAWLKGEFIWHRHFVEDEQFLVLRGSLMIRLCDKDFRLDPGQLVVIPRGVEHMPVAAEHVHVLLLEPAATINTGDATSGRTAQAEWI